MTKHGMMKSAPERVLRSDEKPSNASDVMRDKAWGDEARRRLAAMRSGRMRCYPLAQVMAEYRQ